MAISQAMCTSFKQGLLDGTFNFSSGTGQVFKIALYTSSATLGAATTAYTSSDEVTGTGYTALGKNLTISTHPTTSGTTAYLDFDDVRDYCLCAEKEKLNYSLGSVTFQNENTYFYLGILGARIEKLLNLNYLLKKEKNLDKTIDTIKPPIFWKDKPIFNKQMKKWNIKKLKEAKEILFKTELQIKKNSNLNNNVLLKNLIINLYEKAEATS